MDQISKIKNILIARTDAIGDVAISTIVLPSLRKFFPQAKITFMLRPLTRELLEANPYIDKVVIDKVITKEKSIPEFAKEIKQENYDLFISLWENPIYKKLAQLAGIKFFTLADKPGKNITQHQVYYNLAALGKLKIPYNDPWELSLKLKPKNLEFAEKLFKEKTLSSPIVSLSTGSSGRTKTWPIDHYAKVCDYLIKKQRAVILVHGSSNEKPAAKYLQDKLGPQVIDLTGISVGEMAAVISQSTLYLGGDTGTTHLAAAFKIPSIVIYCEKLINPMRWGPWGNRHIIMYKVSSCPLKCKSLECNLDTCTHEIAPSEVIAATEEILHGGGVNNKKDALWYQKQKALRILILSDGENQNADQLASLLKSNGFYAWRAVNPWQIKKNNAEIIRTNTNIVHYLGNKKWLAKFIQILASNYVPHLPLLTFNKRDFSSIQELINFYSEGFKKQ